MNNNIKREPFREQHLNRLKNLKDQDILVTLGPTKCTKYLFGIFNANDENQIKDLSQEIQILQNCANQCLYIITLYDHWIDRQLNKFIFITEIATSGSLREFINKIKNRLNN